MATCTKVLSMLLLLLTGPAVASEIEVWVRPAGDHAGGGPARGVVARFDPATLPQVEEARADVQYGATRRYRGVPLAALLRALHAPHGADAALLHCRNGMVVPVPLATPPDVLIALSVADEAGAFSAAFPPVAKEGREGEDRRPIRFEGNKLVSASLEHPDVPKRLRDGGFSPWLHTDSLAGVEFVERVPYDAQFEVHGGAPVHEGRDLYLQSCAFCHGARKIGARFGWDFVSPLPAAERHPNARRLRDHVVFQAGDAAEKGLMMPAIRPLTIEDARAVHAWMQALATHPQPAYRPVHRPAGVDPAPARP